VPRNQRTPCQISFRKQLWSWKYIKIKIDYCDTWYEDDVHSAHASVATKIKFLLKTKYSTVTLCKYNEVRSTGTVSIQGRSTSWQRAVSCGNLSGTIALRVSLDGNTSFSPSLSPWSYTHCLIKHHTMNTYGGVEL